jgi:hypothetical protein
MVERNAPMEHKFWGSKRWRCDRWLWGSALVLIGVGAVFTAPPRPGMLLLLLIAGLCFVSAWRRSTMPLYTVTDDALLIGTGFRRTKRLLWRDIKQVQQDGYGVRLIGREWFGGAPLNLTSLPKAQRDAFLQLVRTKVSEVNDQKEGKE